jgi:hypothetical protein
VEIVDALLIERHLADLRDHAAESQRADRGGELSRPELLARDLYGADDSVGGFAPFHGVKRDFGRSGNGLANEQSFVARQGLERPAHRAGGKLGVGDDSDGGGGRLIGGRGCEYVVSGLFGAKRDFAVFHVELGERRIERPVDVGERAAGVIDGGKKRQARRRVESRRWV